jgi:acetyltransferase-like isoleucine patch superfamily enzyme
MEQGLNCIIANDVEFGSGVKLGNHVIIYSNVSINDNVVIGNNVIIYSEVVLQKNVIIQDNVVLGKSPVRPRNSALNYSSVLPKTIIGSESIICTSAIVYIGVNLGEAVFVADLATIRERVTIGNKTIVGRGVAVENDTIIGEKCKLETNCYITAYSHLEDNVFIAPCVVTTNDNYIGRTQERFSNFKGITVRRGGRIGANATILPGKIIEADGVVAAGSIVTKDVMSEVIVCGNPAKEIRKVPFEQLLQNQ